MGKRGKLLELLNVHPGEVGSASLMVLHAFCMGMATVYFETAATVRFLTRFSEEMIPYAYVAAAVVSTLTGIAFAKIRERLSFPRLMLATLALLSIVVGLFRIGVSLSEAAWLVFALLLWYRIISLLTDLEYWAVATRLYDVRQSKRLFPFIGTGEVVARIIGALSVPLLVRHLVVEDLFVLSLIGLLLCMALLAIISHCYPHEMSGEEKARPGEEPRNKGLGRQILDMVKQRYLALMLVMTVFGVLGKYFVDFAFLAEMQGRYRGEEPKHLATFFGLFSGVTQTVNFLTRIFFSGRLLTHFGLKFGLITLPLLHVACTAAIAVVGSMISGSTVVFWLVIGNQAIYKTFKHPIDNPSFKILYQPLAKRAKLSMQIVVELLVTPVALGIAGVIMILGTTIVAYSPVHFAFIMLACFGAWFAVACLLAFKEYPKAIFRALNARLLSGAEVSFADKESVRLIHEYVNSARPSDVIFALHLLEDADPETFSQCLLEFLNHPSPDVREFTLKHIEQSHRNDAVPHILQRLRIEQDDRVMAAALKTLSARGGAGVVTQITPFLDSAAGRIRTAAAIALLESGSVTGAEAARVQLRIWMQSVDPEDRVQAARVAGACGHCELAPMISALLTDSTPTTRRAAIKAIGTVPEPSLRPLLIQELVRPGFCNVASVAAIALGEALLDDLATCFRAHDHAADVQSRVARVMGRIGGGKASEMLWQYVGHLHPGVRGSILEALHKCNYVPTSSRGRTEVESLIRAEVRHLTWLLDVLPKLETGPQLTLLDTAIQHECGRNRRRIFLLLSLLSDPKAILTAYQHLESAAKERRAYAFELLDIAVPRSLKSIVLPAVTEIGPVGLERLLAVFPQPSAGTSPALARVIEQREGAITPWTRACAIFSTVAATATEDNTAIRQSLEDVLTLETDAVIRETAEWALSVMRGDGPTSGGAQAMLTIDKVMILKSVEIFAQTPGETLAELALVVKEVEFPAGTEICAKGDTGTSMYVIVSGAVRVHDGGRTIARLGAREIFGEMAALDMEPRSASITAEEDALCLTLDRDVLFEVMADHTEVAHGVIHVLCNRIRGSNRQHP